MHRAAPAPLRLYALYAAAFLVVTLLAGVWLRAAYVWPGALGGFTAGNLLHAHSHLAFFGWATPALFALLGGWLPAARGRRLRTHAHALALASAAAFVGFLRQGYAPLTIALSTVHVLLWFGFAFLAWLPLAEAPPRERRFARAALGFLVLAGLGAMLPGYVAARGIAEPWVEQMAVQLFLTPFTAGWLTLGAMAAVLRALPPRRADTMALALVALGTLPSALLHATAPPPAEWLSALGRAGTGLTGLGALVFAVAALSTRHLPPLARIAAAAALLKGTAEVAVALGWGETLVGNHSLVIAYLHLVLLAFVTSALLAALVPQVKAPAAALVHAAGLALMLGALLVLGWPAALVWFATLGGPPLNWFALALAGGVLCTLALSAVAAGVARPPRPPAPAAPLLTAPDARPPYARL